jgi:ribosomal protein L13E
MNHDIAPFPIIGLAPSKEVEGSGIVAGTGVDESEETKKRIWKLAEERRIEDTTANRKLAYRIDGLARFIVNIKRFSILKDYILTSKDDTKNEVLLAEIEKFLLDIKLMHIFRQVFTPLQIEGKGHIQKQLKGTTVTSLAVLEHLIKYTNPIDAIDFYYYQSQLVSKKWQDPEETETVPLKIWFIDLEKRIEYTAIKEPEDKVYSRDRIIEILNNESGESNMQPIISFIFIKNFLLQMLPNLIEVITNPHEQIIYDTIDKAGQQCVPRPPPEALKTADNAKYIAQTKTYAAWKAGLTELANRIARDRTKMRKTIHPDTVHEKILESNSSMNSDMIKALIHVLDTQIAYGMGFSLSLIEASGVELASAYTIFTSVDTTMRGTHQMYNDIANALICERFPQAEVECVKFKLDELNPEDELTAAQRKKLYAESAEIMDNIGIDRDSINTFINRNIDEELTFMDSEPVDKAAEQVVAAMLDYRNQTGDTEPEEQ